MSEVAAKEEKKSTILTVTSGTFNEVFAKKLGLEPATEVAEVDPVAKVTEDAAKAEADALAVKKEEVKEDEKSSDDDKKKKKQELNERFSKLTQERNAERQRAEAAERKAAELEAKLNPPKDVPDAEPTIEQFNDINEYKEALKEWSADQALKKRDSEEFDKKSKEERARVVSNWNDRQKAAREFHDDYDEVIASSNVNVSNDVRDAIIEAENGPDILYYLANNPDVGDVLANKTKTSALVEVGKLSAKLAKAAAKEDAKTEEKVQVVDKPIATMSKAPPPINPLKGGSPVETQLASNGEYKGTYAQWKADRAAGKIR